jgi:fluoride exporter
VLVRTLLAAAGGALGAALRFLIGEWLYGDRVPSFPYATFLINVTGCFAIGFLAVAFDERAMLGPGARIFWIVGVLGGYTTFSSFGYETLTLLRAGGHLAAIVNVAGQLILGLAGVALGAAAARAWL